MSISSNSLFEFATLIDFFDHQKIPYVLQRFLFERWQKFFNKTVKHVTLYAETHLCVRFQGSPL